MFFIRKNQKRTLKIGAKLQANIDAGQKHLLLGLTMGCVFFHFLKP